MGILIGAVREQPRVFAISLVGSLAYGLMIIAQAYVLGAITGRVVEPAIRTHHTTASALGLSVLAILGVAFVKIAGIVARRLGAGVMQYRLQGDYRRRVTRRYLQLPLSWHARHSTGELLSTANSDVEALWYPIAPFPFAVGVLVIIVVTVGLLFATDWLLALIGLLVFPAVVVTNTAYARRMSPRVTRAQQLRGEVSGIAHESFEGALVVKTLGREQEETDRFAERAFELRDALVRVGRLRGLFDPMLEAIPNLGTLLVLLVGVSRESTSTLVRVAYLFGLLAFPLRAIGWALAEVPRSVVGHERVQRVLRASGQLAAGEASAPAGAGPIRLRADALRYAYAGHPPVLHGVSFEVAAGRTVALVGATGAGKSTLVSLLVRLVDPDGGAVTVDDVDLRALRPGEAARTVALVAQHTFLFDDTVRGNVTLGASIPDEQVWAALRIAQADGFVAALADGLDSVIGERGTTLSGGQRQRLSLARAVVRRPRLLVLDDATSSVDPSVEQAILAGLRENAAPATTVVVAYRKASIALADEVLFLDAGRIADRGTHPELLARNIAYRRIVSAYDNAPLSA
jgi:ABC-type multidrug transport system fused ATPase/permease subunit